MKAMPMPTGDTDPVARAVGRELYTTYIPLLERCHGEHLPENRSKGTIRNSA